MAHYNHIFRADATWVQHDVFVCVQEERCKAPLILLASLLPASALPSLRLVQLLHCRNFPLKKSLDAPF